MPRSVVHHHFDEDVAGVHAALASVLATVADFLNAFNGQENLTEAFAQVAAANTLLESLLHALLHGRVDVNRVPLHAVIAHDSTSH